MDFGQVAKHYSDTRFMPYEVSCSLISESVEYAARFRPMEDFADVGWGSGRLLRGFNSPQFERVTGFDLSEEMLRLVPHDLIASRKFTLIQCNCASTPLGDARFDLVVLHWVANVTCRWEQIFQNCLSALRPGGALLWFDEQGDLYDAIDGHSSGLAGHNSEFVLALWDHFYHELGNFGAAPYLQLRSGAPLKEGAQEKLAKCEGLKVFTLHSSRRTWRRIVTAEWLLSKVIQAKAFSNFQHIPEKIYERAATRTRVWAQAYRSDWRLPILITYRSTPVLAVQCT